MTEAKEIDPGVYFNMPEADYHAAPYVSRSLIKDMRVSPLYAWENNLDPDRKPFENAAMSLGSAMHVRLLEGQDAFHHAYQIKPRATPGMLKSMAELRAHCKKLDIKAKATIADTAKVIREVDQDVQLYYELEQLHELKLAEGKVEITSPNYKYIEAIVRRIERHPHLSEIISNGYPEVSIFWENELGVRMKCRMDYLAPTSHVLELKTFSNGNRVPINRLLPLIVAREDYHIQPVIYMDGLAASHGFDMEQWHDVPEGFDIDAFKHKFRVQRDLVPIPFIFLFIGTDSKVIRAKGFASFVEGQRQEWWSSGNAAYLNGCKDYLKQIEQFGNGPWEDVEPFTWFDDYDQPIWSVE